MTPTSSTDVHSSGDPTLIDLLSTALRKRLLLARLTLLGALIGATIALFSERTYTADFSFTPQESSGGGGLSAIASDFGLNLGTNASQSPEFYQNLIVTREIIWSLLQRRITSTSRGVSVSYVLIDSIVPPGPSFDERRERATTILRSAIRTRTDLKTSVVSVSATNKSPLVASQLCQLLVEELNRFNSDTRRSRAAAQREFAEQRVKETRLALRAAEDREQSWALSNKIYASSPELAFEKGRYDREVALRDQEYTVAVQQFNAARMEEVHNIPVITIVEPPTLPTRRDPRGLVTKTVVGGFLAFMLGLLIAYVQESLKASREEAVGASADEFAKLRAEIGDELKHPMEMTRRLLFLPKSERETALRQH